jgi:hypothetical protein
MGGACTTNRGNFKYEGKNVEKNERKRPLRRLEVALDLVDWIYLARDRIRCRAVVNNVLTF